MYSSIWIVFKKPTYREFLSLEQERPLSEYYLDHMIPHHWIMLPSLNISKKRIPVLVDDNVKAVSLKPRSNSIN